MASLLIVDNSSDGQRLMTRSWPKRGGHRCRFATTVAEALSVLEQTPIDLVLADLELPAADGLHLVDALRETHPDLPVVLMTAAGTEETAITAIKHGAASYIPKRQLSHWLDEEVEAVLDRRHLATSRSGPNRRRNGRTERFVLASRREQIPDLVRTLQRHLAEYGLGDRGRLMRVGIALEEALMNSVIHGNLEVSSELRGIDDDAYNQLIADRMVQEPYASRRVQVTASLDPHRALIVIRDEGPGFNVRDIPDPTIPENMERAHGRGLLLIRTFFDEVEHNARGNEIRLVLHRRDDREATRPDGAVPPAMQSA